MAAPVDRAHPEMVAKALEATAIAVAATRVIGARLQIPPTLAKEAMAAMARKAASLL